MLEFLAENAGTIVITAVLIVAVALVIRGIVKEKKKGKNSCGCNCASCAMNGACHRK